MRAMNSKIGQQVTLTLKNTSPARQAGDSEFYEITGTVLNPLHKGCYKEPDQDMFFLSVPHTEVSIRAISIKKVLKINGAPVDHAPQEVKTWKVKGTKGDIYTVTRDTSGHYTCDCSGFGFRKYCRHVDEVKSSN